MDARTHWQQQVRWLTTTGGSRIDAVIVIDQQPGLQPAEPPLALSKFLGRSALQRALHHLARAGFHCCALVYANSGSGLDQQLDAQLASGDLGDMTVCVPGMELQNLSAQAFATSLIVLRADFVFDPRLLQTVTEQAGPAKLITASGEILGIVKLENEDVQALLADGELLARLESMSTLKPINIDSIPTYVPSMRRSFPPYWQFLRQKSDLRSAADKVMDSAQKGILDFPARYLHPIPENWLARLAAATSITPNQITVISAVLAFIGTYWFATQQYAAALLMAIVAGILDGVDGKLARIKLLSSPFGDRLDHTLDVSFEFSWYLAIGWGLYQASGDWLLFGCGLLLIAIMLIARGLSGLYLLQTGHQIHDHTAFDRAVRLVAGRRNIYVLVLLAGYLTDNFLMSFYVIIIWGILTVAVYALRNIMVFAKRMLPV